MNSGSAGALGPQEQQNRAAAAAMNNVSFLISAVSSAKMAQSARNKIRQIFFELQSNLKHNDAE